MHLIQRFLHYRKQFSKSFSVRLFRACVIIHSICTHDSHWWCSMFFLILRKRKKSEGPIRSIWSSLTFFSSPKINKDMKDHHWGSRAKMEWITTRALNNLTEKDFEDYFLQWKKRWTKCIVLGGDYLEGDRLYQITNKCVLYFLINIFYDLIVSPRIKYIYESINCKHYNTWFDEWIFLISNLINLPYKVKILSELRFLQNFYGRKGNGAERKAGKTYI